MECDMSFYKQRDLETGQYVPLPNDGCDCSIHSRRLLEKALEIMKTLNDREREIIFRAWPNVKKEWDKRHKT